MSDLRDLYQEVILDHSRKPRNFRVLQHARCANGHNPLCGDRVSIFLDVQGGVIREVSFQGNGCAISTASASMMTEALKGKTLEEAERLFGLFHDLVTSPEGTPEAESSLGKLAVFEGVREFPVRVKCATLPWHTFRAALEGDAHDADDPVRTE
ncbi:MAG TPA: SUF system NifU family Fe-S cluster assembly protein [Candidatus Polarisedimenticolaceae bacterium]|nr:SUF system NifU family Fe-S cluster assembly protein [Candidatus Polarisedimenticolaceae bacterium]